MKTAFTLLVFLWLSDLSYGQSKLESNYSKAQQISNDTAKVNALNFLAKYHVNVDQDSAAFYAEQAFILSNKLNYRNGIVGANLTKGLLAFENGDFPEALKILLQASDEAEKLKDYKLLAGSKLLLGNFYVNTNETDKGIKSFHEGIDIAEKHALYPAQASLYIAVGMGLRKKGELDSALLYYNRVLEIEQSLLHDSATIGAVYNNIGSVYFSKKDYLKTEYYFLKAYEINKLTNNIQYQLMNLGNLGSVFGNMDDGLNKSVSYFEQAIELGKKTRSKSALSSFYGSLSQIYYKHNKYMEAYDNMMLSTVYKDSVMNDKKQEQILSISEEFQTRKIQDSLRINQQELKISQSNESAALLEQEKTTWQLIGAVILLLFILLILIMVYRVAKNRKKINALLQEKNEEIINQKLTIEEKNTELTDSINYAKRIQSALLPSTKYVQKILGDYFLLYKPKDIVSGDFYWVKKMDNKHYFAIADCTGHGVPGAMVSMLGYETIEKISAENFSDAAPFVSKINDALVNSFSSKSDDNGSGETHVNDGMDLALCVITEKRQLSYCGANNECYIIRKNNKEMPAKNEMISIHENQNYSLIELKATKRPIGYTTSAQDFKSVDLQILKDDMIYLFSDGYADQFGGEKGKKMKTSTFREVLLTNANLSMPDQLKALQQYLDNWQNNFDQLDDITVLGVKVE